MLCQTDLLMRYKTTIGFNMKLQQGVGIFFENIGFMNGMGRVTISKSISTTLIKRLNEHSNLVTMMKQKN